nr:uncharacterized protein LOC116806857 [Taeniopygia guttata]
MLQSCHRWCCCPWCCRCHGNQVWVVPCRSPLPSCRSGRVQTRPPLVWVATVSQPRPRPVPPPTWGAPLPLLDDAGPPPKLARSLLLRFQGDERAAPPRSRLCLVSAPVFHLLSQPRSVINSACLLGFHPAHRVGRLGHFLPPFILPGRQQSHIRCLRTYFHRCCARASWSARPGNAQRSAGARYHSLLRCSIRRFFLGGHTLQVRGAPSIHSSQQRHSLQPLAPPRPLAPRRRCVNRGVFCCDPAFPVASKRFGNPSPVTASTICSLESSMLRNPDPPH